MKKIESHVDIAYGELRPLHASTDPVRFTVNDDPRVFELKPGEVLRFPIFLELEE